MSSALVLVVIAGAWAFVLVPMVRHRHDSSTELRSVDRFAGTMRVLSRRRVTTTSTSARVMVTPGAASGPVLSGGKPLPPRSSKSSKPLQPRPTRRVEARVVGGNRVRSAERALLLWRRRALAVALGLFAVCFVVSVAVRGTAGLAVGAVGAVVMVCTLAWLRSSARPAPGAVAASSGRSRRTPLQKAAGDVVRGTDEDAWWHTPVSTAPIVRDRPALRPERRVRRPAARVDVAATLAAGAVVEDQSWGVKLLDLSPSETAAAGGDELFDQTRAAG